MTSKPWYKSKAIWGSLITFTIGVLGLIDNNFGTSLMVQISPFLSVIVSVLGAFGIYARIVATEPIK